MIPNVVPQATLAPPVLKPVANTPFLARILGFGPVSYAKHFAHLQSRLCRREPGRNDHHPGTDAYEPTLNSVAGV